MNYEQNFMKSPIIGGRYKISFIDLWNNNEIKYQIIESFTKV